MAVVLVNSTSANASSSASSLTTSSALSITTGNLIVLVTSIGLSTDTVSSITDDFGNNVYSKAVGVNGTVAGDLEIWYGIAIDGGSLKWTVTWGSAAVNQRILVLQYSGGVGVLDQTNSNSAAAAATTLTTGSVTTTVNNELLVAGFFTTVGQSLTAQNSFTKEVSTPATADTTGMDRIVTATGTYTGQASATSTGYLATIASFKGPTDIVATKKNMWGIVIG